MAHNIDMTNNRANFAFLGSRKDIWHRLGTQLQPGQSIEDWAKAAGLSHSVIMVDAHANLSGPEWEHVNDRMPAVTDRRFAARSDTGHVFNAALSDRYVPVQPREALEFCQHYVDGDPEHRFQIDTAGSLRHGATIWVQATYRDPVSVAGEKHLVRLLMTTTYDGTGSTINRGVGERVVCNNTLDIALAEGATGGVIKTRHNTKFNADRVGRELSGVMAGFEKFKAMGDAMAACHVTPQDTSKLFKHLLDIPFDCSNINDVSTRKANQFRELNRAWSTTVCEGAEPNTAWTALQAVTRYVDHDKSVKGNGTSEAEKRFVSAQFGSGSTMKADAVAFLQRLLKDGSAPSEHVRAIDSSAASVARLLGA